MSQSVLIVEDDIGLAILTKELLELEGFTVEMVHSGNQALQFLAGNSVDVILSDVRMPDGDGAFLLKELNKQGKIADIQFYFYTGFNDFDLDYCTNLGAVGIFNKPLSISKLVEALASLRDEVGT